MAFKKIFFGWLPLGISITLICALIYVAVQQDLRMTANDQSVQVAGDVSTLLSAGEAPQSIIPPSSPIDMAKSLAEYIIIFDASGTPLTSTVELGGKVPVPASGVFAYVAAHGQDTLTWQPASGVRSALVVETWKSKNQSGFVAAGKSLKETEMHEASLEAIVAAFWIATLALSFAAAYYYGRFLALL